MEGILKNSLSEIEQDEMVMLMRRFSFVSNSLYCEKGYELYAEKFVTWIGSKSKRKSGKHVNFYAFDRKDYSELNNLLNRIYLKEKALREHIGWGSFIQQLEEIEDLKRNVIFDVTHENNTQKMNFAKINRELKTRLKDARIRIDESFSNRKFNQNECATMWLEEYEKIKNDEVFKDLDEYFIRNFVTFNIAFQYTYDCALYKLDYNVQDFLSMIQNVNALTFGLDFAPYRNVRAYIREGNWTPVEEEEIYQKMTILADWYLNDKESRKLHPLETAAILNCEIIRTQPYGDGNHRTARLVTNEVLIRADIPPIAINLSQRDEYNAATNKAIETHELDDLIDILYRETFNNATKIEAKLDRIEKNESAKEIFY